MGEGWPGEMGRWVAALEDSQLLAFQRPQCGGGGCGHRLGMLGPLASSEMPGNLEALAKFSLFAFSLAVTLGLVASALLQLVQISGRPIGISFPHTST